jgi:putative tryptophan/tyrosine transport system substrate-binding protein
VPVVFVFSVAPVEAGFAPLAAGKAEAVLVFPDPITVGNRGRIIDAATAQHIPMVSGWAVFAESDALCTYGPRLAASYKRAASYVDRILKGGNPADLPIERPTVFELVVNLKTAAALELAIPQTVLARADDVIE